MRRAFTLITLITVLLMQGCTTTGKIYTGEKGQKFDPIRSGALGVGAAVIYEEIRKSGGLGGGGYSGSSAYGSSNSCTGPYCSYEAAWDYLPGSGQWRCRDTGGYGGGQFVSSWNCSSQRKVDNWQ
jgi:hypothetical protein